MIFEHASHGKTSRQAAKTQRKSAKFHDILRVCGSGLRLSLGYWRVRGGVGEASTSNTRPHGTGGSGTPDPGQVHYHDVPMAELLREAYDVDKFRLSGPNWIESERYSVMQRCRPAQQKNSSRRMVRSERTGAGRGGLARDQDLSGCSATAGDAAESGDRRDRA